MAHNGRKNADTVLLTALASGMTVLSAAKKANISPRTAHRRLADKAFQQRIRALRGVMLERTAAKLAHSGSAAASTLHKLLKATGGRGETVKLGAARTILELSTRLRDAVETEQRLAALEQRLAGGGDNQPQANEAPGAA